MKSSIMFRRKVWKLCYGNRHISPVFMIILWLFLVWVTWQVVGVVSGSLQPPSPPDNDLSHFRRSRSFGHYLDNMEILIEPSSIACSSGEEVPVLVLVSSAPSRGERREAIRNTWAKHLPTYFILGLDGKRNDGQLIENYVEAKQYGDIIVYDFKDHYQNLTLKTGLMLKWTLDRCPQAKFLYKADDDMVINPWILKEILEENGEAQVLGFMHNNSALYRDVTYKWYLPKWLCPEDIIPKYITGPGYLMNGYVHNNSWLHRDIHNKWYLPRWLCREDVISQYATGPGYLINGEILRDMFKTALQVPLHNIEDIYFTYDVAQKGLGYKLTHEYRLNPYRPRPSWLPIRCAYWYFASVHSLKPDEILRIWSYVEHVSTRYVRGEEVCTFYNNYVRSFISVY